MEFRLLGPVELWVAGHRYDVGVPKLRCLLAILLYAQGRPVSREVLIDRLWGEELPSDPHGTLQSYASRLRRQLRTATDGQVNVENRARSYILETDPDAVDVHLFRGLRAQARAIADSGDDEEAARLLREAAGLWRGEALAGLVGDWVTSVRGALEEEWKAVAFDRVETELRLGHHADLIADLYELVARYPFEEKPVECLMLALYRSRRVREAAQAYLNAWQRFATEVAVKPTPELQNLNQRIMDGDPTLAAPEPRRTAARPAAPNLLRRDIAEFTGRADEMGRLLHDLTSGPTGIAVPIAVIHGMPGVGKTALAIRMSHQLAAHYPDGQFFVELHAHDPIQEALAPATALDLLLRALGVTTERTPQRLEERAALWRAQVANRRIVLVLDDAAGAEQIHPLLPGGPECLVIITSRQRLAERGVRSLALDVLPPEDAAELFRKIVGPDRTADTDAVARTVRLCGHLPLAIHIAGTQLRERASWTIDDLAARLARGARRPGHTRLDDNEIAGVFDTSYQDLSGLQQHILRHLGLQHPGANFSAYTAAALADTSVARTEQALDGLHHHHLIEELAPGRFRLHDLLHDYAHDLAKRDDTEHEQRLALHRLLDYYLHTADQADRVLHPHRRRIEAHVEHPPDEIPPLGHRTDAQEWLETEHANLLGVARYAADHGWARHAAMIPHLLAAFLETAGYWIEALATHERANACWEDLGDHLGTAQSLFELSVACTRTGRLGDALSYAERVRAIRRETGDRWGEGEALNHIGVVSWQMGRYSQAFAYYQDALTIRRDVRDRRGEAETLNQIGIVHWHRGNYQEAVDCCRGSLAIYRDIDDQRGQANQLNNIGELKAHLGHYNEAFEDYQKSLAIARSVGMRQAQAVIFNNIGTVRRHTDDHAGALEDFRQALTAYRVIGDRGSEADTLINIGLTYDTMGRHREALIHHQTGLRISQEIGETHTREQAVLGIGDAYLGLKRYAAALDHHREALALARALGSPHDEGRALDGIGRAILHTQGRSAAEPHWRQAVAIFERIGVPDADIVRSRLRSLDATGT